MPNSVSFDLRQLVRICLNDPVLRAEVVAALAEAALPVRTLCMHVVDGDQVFDAILKTDRNKAPGEPGFLPRDNLGWVSTRLSEIIETEHDASTLSIDDLDRRR